MNIFLTVHSQVCLCLPRLPSAHITHVVVTNNIATICCFGNSIFRHDLNTAESTSESMSLLALSHY